MILVSGVAAAIAAGCGDGDKQQGGERQDCYPNGTCNAGLVCLSNTCVDPQTGVGGTGGATGVAGSGGSTGGGTAGNAGGTAGSSAGRGGAAGNTAGTGGSAGGTGGATAGTGGSAGTSACPVPATFGDLGLLAMPPHPAARKLLGGDIFWNPVIAAGPPQHTLMFELYGGAGVFPAGIKNGVYSLTGEETQYATCGLCVEIIETDTLGKAVRRYLATDGVVMLQSLADNLIGSIHSATFRHVTVDSGTFVSAPHPDGCTTALEELKFEIPIVPN